MRRSMALFLLLLLPKITLAPHLTHPCNDRFDLALLAIVVAVNFGPGGNGSTYGALMWGIWLVAASLLAAPFWFNPLR